MRLKYFGNISSLMVLAIFFQLLWWILAGLDNKAIIQAYATTSLPMALLTIDSIFFGAIIVLISILISMTGTKESDAHALIITKPMRLLSIAVATLLIANITSYFTSGWSETLSIYYQVWTLPALMLVFYSLFQQ